MNSDSIGFRMVSMLVFGQEAEWLDVMDAIMPVRLGHLR